VVILTSAEKNVIRTISPNDEMFAGSKTETAYFETGRSALDSIQIALNAAQKSAADVRRILDLPCGHGRVLRYLRGAFPQAEITACDILRDGVDFCAHTFGAVPVYSHHDPAKIPLEDSVFDLIWVGSLFTHLDTDLWLRFLTVFQATLRPGGVLIFSTHGDDAYRKMITGTFNYRIPYFRKSVILHNYQRKGFGYVKYEDSDSYYGLSLSSPAWVLTQVAKLPELRLIHFAETSWGRFHDCFTCVRDPDRPRMQANVSISLLLKHKIRDLLNRYRVS